MTKSHHHNIDPRPLCLSTGTQMEEDQKQIFESVAKNAFHVRMYEQKQPTVGEHVIVRITSVDDISTNVVLVEYEERPALMLQSNASTGRFDRAKKRLTVGHIDVAVVLTIDTKRGFIDVSKKHSRH